MFVRVKRTGDYRYLQVVENRRDGRRIVQHVLWTLGRIDKLEASGGIDGLLRSLARFAQHVRPGIPNEAGSAETGPAAAPEVAQSPTPGSPSATRDKNHGSQAGTPVPPYTPPGIGASTQRPFSKAERRAEMLKKSPIFADLQETHLLELSRIAVERDVKPGQFLYFEGEPARHLYLVVSGTLKLVRHSTSGVGFIIGIYGQGEILRSTSLFVPRPHSSSAQAIVNTRVLAIDSSDLIAFLHQHPPLTMEILGKMLTLAGRRRRAALVQISEFTWERTDYRLARVLLTLSLGLGTTIPLTRREIAELTGTTTETTARFISRLVRRGIVQSFRGKIVLVDQSRLRQLAELAQEQGRRPPRRGPMGQLNS